MSNQVWPWFRAKAKNIAKGEELRRTSQKERAVEGGNRRGKEGIGGKEGKRNGNEGTREEKGIREGTYSFKVIGAMIEDQRNESEAK